MTVRKLYITLSLAIATGYIWLAYFLFYPHQSVTVCIIKKTTGFACPSCGSTRTIGTLLSGNIYEAINQGNPLALVIILLMTILPIWLVVDYFFKKNTLYQHYFIIEKFFQRPMIALSGAVLILLNWAWNISKNL